MIIEFDKPTLRALTDEIHQALDAIAAKHGLRVERNRCTFFPESFVFKATFFCGEGTDKTAVARKEFETYCHLFDLTPEDFGREFTCQFETYRIVGLKPERPKYPILGLRLKDGKTYKIPLAAVQKRA